MGNRIQVNHLARVEGHAGITVELDGDRVGTVQFRVLEGLRLVEGLIKGRRHEDVSQIVSRICAICSAAHTLTSLKATENAFDLKPSQQTGQLRDLLYRGENIESHALHLFLLALPDYLGYSGAAAMAEEHREAVALGLRLKKLGNTIQEIVGGRAVHPVNPIVGGFGKLPSNDDLIALRRSLQDGIVDAESAVELLASLPSTDFCRAETSYVALRSGHPYGYYEGDELIVARNGSLRTVAVEDYRRLTAEEALPYSHAKVSHFDSRPFMVGALARLTVNGGALVTGKATRAMRSLGLAVPSVNPMDNNKAQAVELVYDIEQSLKTVEQLLSVGLKCEARPTVRPKAATGIAATEAPRGLLVHSYTYDREGKIVAADVITPTAMNAASVEEHFRLAVDQSPEKDIATLTRKLEMIARAYDPCISCSVHVIQT